MREQLSYPLSLFVARRVLIFVLIAGVSGCASLPTDMVIEQSSAFDRPQDTSLGKQAARHAQQQSGKSGFAIVDTGREALSLRLASIMAAETGIDLLGRMVDRSGFQP